MTIPRDTYNRLLDAEDFVRALRAHGVDNWEGYSDAYYEVYTDDLEDEEDEDTE